MRTFCRAVLSRLSGASSSGKLRIHVRREVAAVTNSAVFAVISLLLNESVFAIRILDYVDVRAGLKPGGVEREDSAGGSRSAVVVVMVESSGVPAAY